MDPQFNVRFNEVLHGEYPRENLHVGHVSPACAARLTALIKKYWCVFNPDEVRLPITIIGYECDINTGNVAAVRSGKIRYGIREAVVMRKHIAALIQMGHTYDIERSELLSNATLAPKPHQEDVFDPKK